MGYLPTALTEKTEIKSSEIKYKDFYFDETTGTFSGQVVEGVKALKGWIYFALRIARYRYPIYSWKYGSELENLLNRTFNDDDYLKSETKRYIEDALLINPYIKSVENVEVKKTDDRAFVSCTVITKYGDIYIKL